ncbi:MAG: hypothetical protein ATN35_01180 [Epulopiscium sp. Nele67-Bin004]|nr:MAG: hypothetical protein ATN35_01180 [Epulopiscium sp. Nele67-Bin004]
MFKKILALGIGAFALTGCNAADIELYNLMNETTEFEAFEFVTSGTIELIAGADSATIAFEQTGYASQADELNSESISNITIDYTNMVNSQIEYVQTELEQAIANEDAYSTYYLEYQLDSLEEMQQLFEELATTPLTMTQYIIDNVCYISTDYMKQMVELTGAELDIEFADYLDYGDLFAGMSLSAVEALASDFEDEYAGLLASLFDVSSDGFTTKDGDVYTVTLGTEEIVTILGELMDNIVYNLDVLGEAFNFGGDLDELAELQAEYTESVKPQFIEMAKLFLDANLTLEYYVLDDVHYEDLDMYIGMKSMFGEDTMGVQIKAVAEVSETTHRELELDGTTMLVEDLFEDMFTITETVSNVEVMTISIED